jgi:hypothetical protein
MMRRLRWLSFCRFPVSAVSGNNHSKQLFFYFVHIFLDHL